jgi:catechol 2,3-dioxygenase-like lactoylglutathione lyase family enzyme
MNVAKQKWILLLATVCCFINISFGQVEEISSVGITVSNMERSVAFFNNALGFKKISDVELQGTNYENLEGIYGLHMRVVRMQLGDEYIDLTDYLTSGGRPVPTEAKSNDLIFQHIAVVVSDMDKAYRHLRKHMVEYVSSEPQTLPVSNPAAAGIKAFYFHDPDRHNIELIWFPKGKGQPKWQNANGKLFLGIDHTAIGISNTDSSLVFYQDILGIKRKGESWNMGKEQAHLNFVEGASLHITGLRAASGPGIEFLQYLKPGPGKPYPSDTRADDIWYWQTTLVADDIQKIFDQVESAGYRIVSKGMVSLQTRDGKQMRAFIVRDRDGHAMLITEKLKQT